ncbi:hypothetical protein ACLOJK_019696, partial [Asimina triloba]
TELAMALLQRQTETQRRMLANPSRLLPPDLRYAAPIFSVTMVEFNEEDDGVVHAEVAEVGADPEDGLAEAGREAESVAVSHLVPWPAGGGRRASILLAALRRR